MYAILFLIFTSPNTLEIKSPDVEIVKYSNMIYITSKQRLDSVYIEGYSEWCSYFVYYEANGCNAIVKITTKEHPLNLVVRTNGFVDFFLNKKEHRFKIRK